MYEDAETELAKILKLVDTVPETLKGKCFEILLQGYVTVATSKHAKPPVAKDQHAIPSKVPSADESQIPAELLPRFKNTAKRLGVDHAAIEKLFDFGSKPFTFHAYQILGANNAEKTRNVALYVAAKSYLANGTWVADWKEVKAQCVDQNCYDVANFASHLKSGKGSIFKTVEVGQNIELASPGITSAETLIKALVTGKADNVANK